MLTPSSDTPEFPERWLTRAEVLRRTGKSDRTIRRWVKTGAVRTRTNNGVVYFGFSGLVEAHKAAKAAYADRQIVPGLGRGNRHPATDDIRARIDAGQTNVGIARAVGCSTATVARLRKETNTWATS